MSLPEINKINWVEVRDNFFDHIRREVKAGKISGFSGLERIVVFLVFDYLSNNYSMPVPMIKKDPLP